MQSLPLASFQTPTKKSLPPYYSPHNDSPPHQQKFEFSQRDYGKAKGIEILAFKDCELERTFASQTSFIAAGTLHVIYFEAYNRFILSINDWRYILLRRMPVVGSDTRLPGPVTYTLPTCDGFYTLRLIHVDNMASLKNFETILANSSKFSSKENVNNSSKRMSGEYVQNLSEFKNAEPTPLTKSDRWKRGFRKLNSKLSNSFKRRDRPNLNLYQVRDFESLKRTNEIMAPLHFLPKREIDSLISMHKDVANKYGFQPETHSSGLQNCPLTPIAESKINQTAFTNPFASPSPTRRRFGGITASPQPEKTGSIGNMALNHAINPKNYGASQPRLMDRIKARIPGEHHYYGEKTAGEKIMTHSHSLREQRRTSQPRRTIKEVLERSLKKEKNDEGSLLDSFTTEQDPYDVALSPKFAEHEDTLEIARKRSLELVEKYTKDYLAHKEKMSRFSTQSKMSGAEAQNSFGVDLETADTPEQEEKESCEVMLDSKLVGRREAKGLRKRVALKIDYENEENVLDLDSILRSEGLEQCEG